MTLYSGPGQKYPNVGNRQQGGRQQGARALRQPQHLAFSPIQQPPPPRWPASLSQPPSPAPPRQRPALLPSLPLLSPASTARTAARAPRPAPPPPRSTSPERLQAARYAGSLPRSTAAAASSQSAWNASSRASAGEGGSSCGCRGEIGGGGVGEVHHCELEEEEAPGDRSRCKHCVCQLCRRSSRGSARPRAGS